MACLQLVYNERPSTVRLPSKREICRQNGRVTVMGALKRIHARPSTMHNTPSDQSNDLIDILLIEDNPGDIRLTQEAFKTTDQEVELQTITRGDNAVDFLQQSTENSLPDLVLLDLNLPGRDGCEVLEAIRDNSRLRPLPVIMLTNSEADEDIVRCYDASANAYLTKPTSPDGFIFLVETLKQFWCEKVQLPPIS